MSEARDLPEYVALKVRGKFKKVPCVNVLQIRELRDQYVRNALLELQTWRMETAPLLLAVAPGRELEAIVKAIDKASVKLKTIWPSGA